eukprot:CAMPEP_0184744510 /NCGR_PEP_ID=MMETSP0315-20130426/7235_1 /TAXON_ID=101924 /ORGANISM="Rhodosorus marinus, Strain UTEX LB 2760" /LENGTH=241 /DNA_ID=CAMNT_0027216219 /DNA_START=141 /DNA_END=866 /DNA_ORIENTATION=-
MSNLVFKQLFEKESSTYTYIVGDEITKEAVIIDPVDLTAVRDANLIKELGLNIKYALNTHVHADHITGTHALRGHLPNLKSALSEKSGGRADAYFKQGDHIKIGGFTLDVLETPGHTDGCVSFYLYGSGIIPCVFTGDAVLIRGCGRTDFQQGSSETLYLSVWERIFSLPKETIIYPAHDYKGLTSSSVGEELAYNSRLLKKKEEFIEVMANLNLPYPKKIDAALPMNLADGDLKYVQNSK